MQPERHVRLFRNGRNQAVRIPRDFEMDGNEAIIRKEGNKLILEPVGLKNRLLELLKTLDPIQEEFPTIEDPPVKDEDYL
jgi:antitoxin VapB